MAFSLARLFGRIQNLHISQTKWGISKEQFKFGRIQNLHISQTYNLRILNYPTFGRIQNLHISQTKPISHITSCSLVEFKIYISLKQK